MKLLKMLPLLLLTWMFQFNAGSPLTIHSRYKTVEDSGARFSETICSESHLGLVTTKDIYDDGVKVGHSIWINRSRVDGKQVKAKYFAHKQFGQTVHERYDAWRTDKDIVLMSIGAYSQGWAPSDIPVGIAVDNGEIVNRNVDSEMDGLVVVEAVGGIRISDIENPDLHIAHRERIDIRDSRYKIPFLHWARDNQASIFQTHLLVYKDELKFSPNASQRESTRKFLTLGIDENDVLHHVVFYLNKKNYSLYDGAAGLLGYLKGLDMQVFAVVNIECGGQDIMSTGKGVKDCTDRYITGRQNNNRQNMSNMLVYHLE